MVEKMEVEEAKPEVIEDSAEKKSEILFNNIKDCCLLLEKGESFILGRLLQSLTRTRKELNAGVLGRLINQFLHNVPQQKEALLALLPTECNNSKTGAPMEIDVNVDTDSGKKELSSQSKSPRVNRKGESVVPEIELYIHILSVLYLVDAKNNDNALKACQSLIDRVDILENRSLDAILAKAFYYYGLMHERNGKLESIIGYFNARLRTATLRHQKESQAVLINYLIRAYIVTKQYHTAAQLLSKVVFPEHVNNNELARFYYYQGRIRALQLKYKEAFELFENAFRKAPQNAAVGFKQNVQKWMIVLCLLRGEVPDKTIFKQEIFRGILTPYYRLANACRKGDVENFDEVVSECRDKFVNDEILSLVVRLRQNVIRTAVRNISLAYSKIGINEIAKKLGIKNSTEVEYLVAKAIKDGNINAYITFDKSANERFLQSREIEDMYKGEKPQLDFDSRIKTCLELHNHLVRALRFPPNNKGLNVETIEEQRKREQQELDFVKELAEEDDDDF
ncbi:26S proteasome non-ATPase regulatory subunit 3 [Strongyloides ratti]|uniref:26S proteasome non-ATPase regulatory subunit 3 n=1 Tax=Strongyloides ratti TaxID=34506 RepID=A0A090L3M9_STRRB|nr:26S proteasome non-ATPase regulatory subunit 3 [Strongyloides ratti]CEF64421.1 26S proteasome non-ATPase regulatory subunit 3 [Strongyloides ratti]